MDRSHMFFKETDEVVAQWFDFYKAENHQIPFSEFVLKQLEDKYGDLRNDEEVDA